MENTTQNKPANRQRNILLILLLLSLVLNFFQFFRQGRTEEKHAAVVDSMTVDMETVEKELELTKSELEQYRGISNQLDSLLNDANDKIAEQEKKIRALVSKGQKGDKLNAELKKELESLKKLRDELLEKIDQLITENKRLQNEKDSLSGELDNNISVRKGLEARMKVAEQIRVDKVSVKSYKKRAIGGKLVETSLAKRAVKLDVCFMVLENQVATKGNKRVSLRILNPEKEILAGTSNAMIVETESGSEIPTTSNKDIDFQGASQDICLAWEDETVTLKAGEYTIEIYIEGTLVFTSGFSLE